MTKTAHGNRREDRRARRRIAKLGIADFETVDDLRRRQRDLVRRLADAGLDTYGMRRLRNCSTDRCARKSCSEACPFAAYRLRLKEIPAAYRLISRAAGPIYEVRVARGSWARPIGELAKVSLAAATQLNRRALDTLYIDIVAVGLFTVSAALDDQTPHWVPEIHAIVAGAEQEELEGAFSADRASSEEFSDILRVKKVENLAQTLSDVFRRDVQGWQHPWQTEMPRPRPKKAHRAEYYRWLLGLSRSLVVRYGCDRHFNKLSKEPRVIRPKKERPYPHHLVRHMFGGEKWQDKDPQEYDPTKPPRPPRSQRPKRVPLPDDYYSRSGSLPANDDKSWARKSAQDDRWSFCLTAGTL